MLIREPPSDCPMISRLLPSCPCRKSCAVFGCASFNCASPNSMCMPCSSASISACGIRASSGCIPSNPATSAFRVPCPFPVVRKLPYNKIRAETGCSPNSFRLIYPILTAPAVWELDGPTITGPTTSNIFIASLSFFCIMRFLPSNYVKHTIET